MQVKGGAMDRGRGRVGVCAAGVEPYALDPDEGRPELSPPPGEPRIVPADPEGVLLRCRLAPSLHPKALALS
ncbi:unnamed protein product [Boreogadus saida]